MLRLLKPGAAKRTPSPAGAEERADPLRALVSDAKRGDVRATRTLIVALGPALLRVIRGVLGTAHPDVEDVLQESMTAFVSSLPAFREDCKAMHFACRIALQTALNARRRASYRNRYTPSAAPEELELLGAEERSPADLVLAARRREAVRTLLLELPAAQSEALALHTMLGYTVEETAATSGVPINTVRSRLRAALATLRDRVQDEAVLCDTLDGGA